MKNLAERMPKDLLKWTAAGFALAATATAEYEIAREIGMNEWIAAAVPGALDAYVVRALRSGREVLASVTAMVGVNAASHLVTAGILPVEWPLITAVSAIAPLVLWRVHALGHARHADVHTSTEPEHTEHDRAPDNPEPSGTREHPEDTAAAMCPLCGWGCPADVLGKHIRDTCPKRFEHTASTDQERVRAQTDAWGDDWLDVHDAVHAPSTPPLPVHAPYVDHVHIEHADPGPVLLPFLPSTQPMKARHLEVVPDPVCPACSHALDEHSVYGCLDECACERMFPAEHAASTCLDPGELDDRDGVTGCADGTEHIASTRTADDWNLEHVSTGTLTPEDTEHMERARELFHTIGGVPPFRALKHGTPGMGTDRAKRIRAALEIENKGTD